MAVKKGILEKFLTQSSHYADNQKNLRSIFIDRNEDDLKPDPQNFLENAVLKENPIGTQLEHNKDTIGTQNDYVESEPKPSFHRKVPDKEHNRNTIRTQQEHVKEHNKDTSRTQLEHKNKLKNTIGTQQEHVKEHKIEHKGNTIETQQEHNRDTQYGLSYLTGIQKQLVLFFYVSCKKTRSHITEEFSLINIADALRIRLGSVKTSLRRLEEKHFIKSVQFKKGRGGWTKFELPDAVYRELLMNEKEHNWNTIGAQQEHIKDTYRNTEKDTNASSSSSFKNTTTTNEIDEAWDFDISAYSRFGFAISHIKQLSSLGTISANEVEQSLIEFNYDLDNNALPPIKTNKINFLMGLLRGGRVYVSEAFRNEQETIISEMSRRAEEKQKKLLEEKFIVWASNLTNEEKHQIEDEIPVRFRAMYKTHGIANEEIKNWLFNYYVSLNEEN